MSKWYLSMLPWILPMVGSYLKGRDSDSTGADDAVGSIVIALAPAIEGLQSSDESAMRKAMTAVRDAADVYLRVVK